MRDTGVAAGERRHEPYSAAELLAMLASDEGVATFKALWTAANTEQKACCDARSSHRSVRPPPAVRGAEPVRGPRTRTPSTC
jgi:hypothetical protein